MSAERELHLYGEPHVVIVQCNEDPGDMGEPRVVSEDDTTYVFVPSFELWPGGESRDAIEAEMRARGWQDEYEVATAAAMNFGEGRAEAGHRTPESHDCFLMNCADLGGEVRRLSDLLVAARTADDRLREARSDALDSAIAIVQQSLDSSRYEAGSNPDRTDLMVIAARDHIIKLLTHYRDRIALALPVQALSAVLTAVVPVADTPAGDRSLSERWRRRADSNR